MREAHFCFIETIVDEQKGLLWLGWQTHCVAKSSAREKYENSTWFSAQNSIHVFNKFPIHAGGEKPERQQHICNEHVQKRPSHARGVAKTENVTRAEGAKQKKK